ncbi:MAG: ATP-dependent Clp protease ATP-binding subunit [Patescibacteria group bacterium]
MEFQDKTKFIEQKYKGQNEICGQVSGKILCWQQSINDGQIFINNLNNFLYFFINLILVFGGVVGLICLVNRYVEYKYLEIIARTFVNNPDNEMLFFWWAILFWMYLIYRLKYRADKKHNNKIASVVENLKGPQIIEISNGFSEHSKKIILETWKLANSLQHEEVIDAHLFVTLLKSTEIKIILGRLGISRQFLRDKITGVLSRLTRTKTGTQFSTQFKKILIQAYIYAYQNKKPQVSLQEIVLALVMEEGVIKDLFYDLEIEPDDLKNVIAWIDINHRIQEQVINFQRKARFKPKSNMDKAWTAIATPFLNQFGQDLTALAREGYLPLCVGRDNEINQIMRLIEAGKTSLLLVGYPDVGCNTIIEEIAQLMVSENVPEVLQDKRLVSLSVSSLIAGGSEIGEIEGRLQRILAEVMRAGNVVLFISDVHNMIGVTTSNGEMDLSEMLSEALGQGGFMAFATSDPVEYKKYLENKSLGNTFDKVDISEPDKNQTIQILESKVGPIECKQEVYFSYESLNQIFQLAERYVQDRALPKKAIDLLEEVAVYARQKNGKGTIVTGEDVAEIISQKTGMPTTKVGQNEANILLNLEDKIHERMVDQVQAVSAVANALRRARTELRDLKKPINNLLFLGPTGVGKTELAKTVAALYFGSEERMIRLDMSEYQEQNSIERLIGKPGQTGGGLLTEAVRKNPYALLLLDEIEKAHPDVLNIFLQVLDDGRLTDNDGQTVDFTNLIIIATSNAGTQFIQDKLREGSSIEAIKDTLIREKLKDYFKPEFLNRFDDIVVFKTLSIEEINQITELFLKKLKKQMLEKGITFEVTPEAVSELAQAGFDPQFGARPLKRAIQEKVSNALAQYLLVGKLGRRDVAIYDKGGVIRVEKAGVI